MKEKMRKFAILDVATGERLYTGVGICAQDVFESYRAAVGNPIMYPLPGDLDSDNEEIRLNAMAFLNDNEDSWIDDTSISMKHLGDM